MPARWVDVRAAVAEQAEQTDVITQDQYLELCAEPLANQTRQALRLSEYLHDLGVFLHFQKHDLLKRLVILRNEWVTGAVFAVVNDETIKASGRFTAADGDRIWTDDAYAGRHLELRALMEQFDLCYRLPHVEPETWLVPQLLSPERPDETQGWEQAGDLTRRYRYDFLPKGIVSRLIVRENRYVTDPSMAWTDGAVLQRDNTELLAHVAKASEIELRARGPEAAELLATVAADLDELNGTYGDLIEANRVHVEIPCCCEQCQKGIDPIYFDLSELLKRRASPDAPSHVNCSSSYKNVEVQELLAGISVEVSPEYPDLPTLAQAMLSGARRLNYFAEGSAPTLIEGDNATAATALGDGATAAAATGDGSTAAGSIEESSASQQDSRSLSWPRVSALSGIAAAALTALLIVVQSASWRIAIGLIAAVGLTTFLIVLRFDPARFYRRLVYLWFATGTGLALLSISVNGSIQSEWLESTFELGNEVPRWWWIVWAVVLVALLIADFFYRRDREQVIDLRDDTDGPAAAPRTAAKPGTLGSTAAKRR